MIERDSRVIPETRTYLGAGPPDAAVVPSFAEASSITARTLSEIRKICAGGAGGLCLARATASLTEYGSSYQVKCAAEACPQFEKNQE